MGALRNNLANCYRRMGRFEDAYQALDTAVELLAAEGGASLASAYGSRGLTLRDQGRDEEAVEWFRKARAEHAKQPSPNLETVAEELKNEADALRRLSRLEEAEDAEGRRASVLAVLADIPTVDRDLSGIRVGGDAVLVHLDFGSRPGRIYGKKDAERLKKRLAALAEEQDTGCFSGWVMIPESTTLIFYGTDGEALFTAMGPSLLEEPMCRGARVTIRQGDRQREVYLEGQVM
jgi:tetratricopeptide (TPR) repeat protein